MSSVITDKISWIIDKTYSYSVIGKYERSNTIYHYTSPEGLLGILKTGTPSLWFTKYDVLNDASEGKHIIDIYNLVCNKLYSQHAISSAFYETIKDVVPNTIETFSFPDKKELDLTNIYSSETDVYVCCFSKNRDSLPMWNYYTKSNKYEGYNVGFSFFDINNSIKNALSEDYTISFRNVIYDDSKKEEIVSKELLEIYRYLGDQASETHLAKLMIGRLLRDLQFIFKPAYFSHEEEVRAIISLPREQHNPIAFTRKYRTNNGYIIPYIEVNFSSEIAKSITIAPLLNDEAAKETVKLLFQDRNYSITDIENSRIPIRY